MRVGQKLKSEASKRDRERLSCGQWRDEVHSSLKCRGHAGCSCTYQITTSSSDKHKPSCTPPPTPAPTLTHHTPIHIVYKYTSRLVWRVSRLQSCKCYHCDGLPESSIGAYSTFCSVARPLAPVSSLILCILSVGTPSSLTRLPWLTSVRFLFLRNICTLYSPLSFLSFSGWFKSHCSVFSQTYTYRFSLTCRSFSVSISPTLWNTSQNW